MLLANDTQNLVSKIRKQLHFNILKYLLGNNSHYGIVSILSTLSKYFSNFPICVVAEKCSIDFEMGTRKKIKGTK